MATEARADRSSGTWWPVSLCWSAVLLDGYDLVVLGTVLPVLLRTKEWGLTPGTASLVATVGLVGMTIGALANGTVTDVLGRRKALMLAVTVFSLFTLLCAVATSAWLFGLFRFLAGLGLGGCLPSAITLVTEWLPRRRSSSATTTIMTGYHVGAVLTALLGIVVLPSLGWRVMFVLGAAPALVLLPLMLRHLPESASFAHTSRRSMRDGLNVIGSLFSRGSARATVAFCVTSFMGLLLVYGLNTWLPEIMRSAGYELGAALSLLLTLNIGAVIGLVIAGAVADRIGVRRSTLLWFGLAAIALSLLSFRLPLVGVYTAVLIAGCFVFSAQVLVYAYVGRFYPESNRATGLGWAAGVGRIGAICGPLLGGALLSAGVAYPWGFYAFAIVGALGAVAILAVGTSVASTENSAATRVAET
jgi:MFS transporter, AAHS family, benzoate transport protein